MMVYNHSFHPESNQTVQINKINYGSTFRDNWLIYFNLAVFHFCFQDWYIIGFLIHKNLQIRKFNLVDKNEIFKKITWRASMTIRCNFISHKWVHDTKKTLNMPLKLMDIKLKFFGINDFLTIDGQSWEVFMLITKFLVPTDLKIGNHRITHPETSSRGV